MEGVAAVLKPAQLLNTLTWAALAVLLSAAPASPKRLRVLATAYHRHGITRYGEQAGKGSIAVDPRVITPGTRLYVPGYGYGRANDTGDFRGRRIDVWLPSRGGCLQWGARKLEIHVLEGEKHGGKQRTKRRSQH
jgi:3D (Asp-Asp-Asp) domain-containing protein